MTLTNILIISFLIVIIIFNIWNALTLYFIKKRPSRNDELNDAKYWELKFKIQFLVAAFSAIVAIAAFLGYNTLDNVRDGISKEINLKLDSTKSSIAKLDDKQKEIDDKVANTDEQISKYQDIILGLSNKQASVKESIKLSKSNLDGLKERITEINSKNILQQNIYIVDTIQFDISKLTDEHAATFKYSDLVTISGDKIPPLKNPPYILPISNQDCEFHINQVTNSSFRIILWSFPGDLKVAKVTLFITVRP
jgi:hypothetical protein